MSMSFMRAVRDFNQLTYAAKTISRLQASSYSITVSHAGLGRSRVIRGSSKEYVTREANRQCEAWDATWQNQRAAAASRAQREAQRQSAEQKAAYIANRKLEQERLTSEAAAQIAQAEGLLAGFREFSGLMDWDSLAPDPKFKERKPVAGDLGPAPVPEAMDPKPERGDSKYELQSLIQARRIGAPPLEPTLRPVGFIGSILGGKDKARAEFEAEHANWRELQLKYQQDLPAKIEAQFLADLQTWESETKSIQDKYDAAMRTRKEAEDKQARELEDWTHHQQIWPASLAALGARITSCRDACGKGVPLAVADYFSVMLESSRRPSWVPREWTIQYNAESRYLDVFYHLPDIGDIPAITGYTYVQKDDSFTEVRAKKTQLDALYDSVIYQLALLCIHDTFKSDAQSVLAGIRFNGYVATTNKATGIDEDLQILCAQCERTAFEQLKLANVDPGACFTAFEGATQAKPHLLKKVTSPKSIPIVDDQPQNTVMRGVGPLAGIVAYRKETSLAQILAIDKEPAWEYALSVELLRSKIKAFSTYYGPGTPEQSSDRMSDAESVAFISDALTHIEESFNQLPGILNDELLAAWGAPGSPGDEMRILEATNHVMGQLHNILAIEKDIFFTKCSYSFQEVANAFGGVTELVRSQCARLPDAIAQAAADCRKASGAPIQLKLELSLDAFTNKVSPLLAKVASKIQG